MVLVALLLALPAGLLPVPAAADTLPLGTFIDEGLSIDLTRAGIARPVELAVANIPPDLVIGTTPGQELIDLLLCSQDFQVQNLVVFMSFETATVSSSAAGMFLDVDLQIRVNSSGDPAWVVMDGCFDFSCFLYTDPATLVVELPMQLQLLSAQQRIDLQLGPLNQNIGWIIENTVHFGGCPLWDIHQYLVENWGLDLVEFVTDELINQLEAELAGMLVELEVAVEDALQALWIEGTTEVAEAAIEYTIQPTAVEHTNGGLRLQLGGLVQPLALHPCTERFDEGGSPYTPSSLPPLMPNIFGTSMGYDLSVVLSDDLPNQALWSLWRAGALCFEAAELGGSPLTTTLLAIVLGEEIAGELEAVLGEAAPVLVRVVPERVPQVRYDGDFPFRLEATELPVEFWGEVLDRHTRITSITADIVGVADATIDSTGALVFDLELRHDEMRERVTYNEFFAHLDPALLAAFPALMDLALDSIIGAELAGGAAPLPTIAGFGLDTLLLQPVGANEYAPDHLVAYATIGPSDGGGDIACDSTGCAAMEGCGGAEGCAALDGGCGDAGGCVSLDGGCDAQSLIIENGCSGELGTSDDEGCRIVGPVRVGTLDAVGFALLLLVRRRRRGNAPPPSSVG